VVVGAGAAGLSEYFEGLGGSRPSEPAASGDHVEGLGSGPRPFGNPGGTAAGRGGPARPGRWVGTRIPGRTRAGGTSGPFRCVSKGFLLGGVGAGCGGALRLEGGPAEAVLGRPVLLTLLGDRPRSRLWAARFGGSTFFPFRFPGVGLFALPALACPSIGGFRPLGPGGKPGPKGPGGGTEAPHGDGRPTKRGAAIPHPLALAGARPSGRGGRVSRSGREGGPMWGLMLNSELREC